MQQIRPLGKEQFPEDDSELQTTVETPIDRAAACAHFSRECLSPAELALLPDKRQRLDLLLVEHVQIKPGGWSTILAQVNGLLLSAIHDSGEMNRGFILMTFGAKHGSYRQN